MSVDYVWVCDALKESVDPAGLPGCTGHQVTALRQPSAGVLVWLATVGRWAGNAVRVEGDAVLMDISGDGDAVHRAAGYADVTAKVSAEMAENANAELLAKTTRLNYVGEHATRLQAAIEQNESDAQAMLAALDVACPLLPDDVKASLEARARDILRTDTKALAGEQAHRADIMVRAQREDMMRRRIAELVAERDGARAAAHALAGVETKVALGPDAVRAAESFAASALNLSGAEWAKVVAAPASDRLKAFVGHGADAAVLAEVGALRAELAKTRAELAAVPKSHRPGLAASGLGYPISDATFRSKPGQALEAKALKTRPKKAPAKKVAKRPAKAKKGGRR